MNRQRAAAAEPACVLSAGAVVEPAGRRIHVRWPQLQHRPQPGGRPVSDPWRRLAAAVAGRGANRHAAVAAAGPARRRAIFLLAKMEYALCGASLEVTLEVTNTGGCALPFGLGLHPLMPRSAGVTLRAPAREVWLSGADRLPATPCRFPKRGVSTSRARLPATLGRQRIAGWDGMRRNRVAGPRHRVADRSRRGVLHRVCA